jgi:hypothetical protein
MERDRGQVWVEGLDDRKPPLLCALENISKVAKAEKASEKASEYDQGPEIQRDFDLAKGLKFNEALISQFNVDPKVEEYLKNGQISQVVAGGQVCESVRMRMCIYAHAPSKFTRIHE